MFTYPNVPRCHYIKVNGTRCGSPALRNQKLCYFHQRWHEQRVTLRGYPDEQNQVQLPVLEDANSIQMALTQVMRLVLSQKISHKEAGLLLYALQIASANLKRTKFEIGDEEEVVIDPATLAKAGVGVNSWKRADFPNPIPADPAPDAPSSFTPDPAQPVFVMDKKAESQPAVIPDLKAEADERDDVERKGFADECDTVKRKVLRESWEGTTFSRAAKLWLASGLSRCGVANSHITSISPRTQFEILPCRLAE